MKPMHLSRMEYWGNIVETWGNIVGEEIVEANSSLTRKLDYKFVTVCAEEAAQETVKSVET